MTAHGHLESILELVVVSVVGPVIAVRLKLPTAVTLILAGVCIGPAGLGLVSDTPTVSLLSELGFLMLMFLAGMELDFESLRGAGRRALLMPSLSVLGFTLVAIGLKVVLRLSTLEALIVSASSVGMPLAVLQETHRLATPLGRHVLLTASVGEFVSILAITGFELLSDQGTLYERGEKTAKVVALFVVSALLIQWTRAIVWWRPEPFRRLLQHRDVAELGVRSGLLVMFAFVVIAERLGVEAILGAFIAGALVAFVLREKHTLESKIAALGHGLFIPIFFVVVGLRFDPGLLDLRAVRYAAVLAAIAAVVKVVPSLMFAGRELSLRERTAAGALLASPLTLIVAIAAIGRRLGSIDAADEASFVFLALLLSVGFPIVFRLLVGSAKMPASQDESHTG